MWACAYGPNRIAKMNVNSVAVGFGKMAVGEGSHPLPTMANDQQF